MLSSSITIENMNHLGMSFPTVREIKPQAEPIDAMHSRQWGKRRIKVNLLFVVPQPQDTNYDFLDQPDREELPRIISVKIPHGLSVAKVRPFINYIEGQLQDIYGRSKKLNFQMVCEEKSEMWKFQFEIPDIGVYYV